MKSNRADLSYSTAAGRWARLGPYYAMFPIPFVESILDLYAKPGHTVIDPFCGRGTVPFIAMVNGIRAIGCDVNPVAWLYAKTKTAPHGSLEEVKDRISQLQEATESDDYKAESEFQKTAFCPSVLAFIKTARGKLAWRTSSLDRTVATLLIQHLHDKRGRGLSNQMRHSRSLSPRYCIEWWKRNGYSVPPEIDTQKFLHKRAEWRYAKGTPRSSDGKVPTIILGNSATALLETDTPADLVLTSPPYSNVTNYRADNWLRLWALGEGPSLPDWKSEQKFANIEAYRRMLKECLTATQKRTHSRTIWYIRSDARLQTKEIITAVMDELLPDHRYYENPAPYPGSTQTALYGDPEPKPGEIDLLYMPPRRRRKGFTRQFSSAK